AIDDQPINVVPPAFPNLIVDSVNAPVTAFSGQQVTIDWVVKNIGSGATNTSSWVDRVYLSLDGTLDANDTLLGTMQNASYLNAGDSYRSTFTAALPQGISNNYRFIVVADAANNVPEPGAENDNTLASAITVVNLTPPPDLFVTSVSAP